MARPIEEIIEEVNEEVPETEGEAVINEPESEVVDEAVA